MKITRALAASMILTIGVPALHASIVTVPASVPAGSTYRLIFVTSAARNAVSANINDYNTFVTDAANSVPELAELGATWFAVASTFSTSAANNVGASTAAIYRLDGLLVASSTNDLWDGTIDASISVTETGSTKIGAVWTGSDASGNPYFPLSHSLAYVGYSERTDATWMKLSHGSPSSPLSFYAISSELTAPQLTAAVPEPASATLVFCGGLLAVMWARRRRGQLARLS